MNLADFLDRIFDEGSTVTVFDGETDEEVQVTIDAADAATEQMTKPIVDLVSDGKLFGLALSESYEEATFALTNGTKTLSVFLFDEPQDPDLVLDDEDVISEVPFFWEMKPMASEYYTLEEVNEITIPTEDVSDDDTPEPVSVPDADMVDEETGSEASEEVPDDGSAPNEEATYINDAEVLGVETPEMVELLQQDVVFMTGELWDQGDRRNTPAGKWKRNEMPWMTLLTADWSPLTKHEKSANKQGKSIVLGETIDGNRNAESVKNLHAIVIDVDSGPKVDDVIAKLQKLGLFALVYTSFNHNKTKVVLKHDDVVRKMKLDDTPNRVQVIEYLRVHHKDRYDEDFLEDIEIVDARKHGPKGLQIVLETPPLHKFRIVLPLQQPVELADLGTTATQWKDAWANIVTGFVVNELGVSFDSTSCDVNRLFYTPRHAEGKEWDCVIIQGKPLNVDDIQPHSKNEYLKNRDNDPFSVGDNNDDRPPLCLTPSGKSLNKYHSEYKDRFLITELLLAECPDKVRREVSDGKLEIECPFEHEHSTEGGTGTVVMSPEVNEHGVWTISCPHDACQGRHKLQFLEEMLKAGWFDEALLRDPEYLLGGEDEEEEEKTPEPPKDAEGKERTVVDMARDLPDDIGDDEIKRLMKRALEFKASRTEKAKVTEVLLKKMKGILNKNDMAAMWKEAASELKGDKKEESSDDGDPIVNRWDFKRVIEYGTRRIQDYNEQHPSLFHYMEEMARIEQNANGDPRIRIMNFDRFHAEINMLANWVEEHQSDGKFDYKNVPLPIPHAKQLFNARTTVLPTLRGLITSPAFVGEGVLVDKAGYHENCSLYYEPDLTVDIPKVKDKPTEEDVEKAVALLIDAIADFPLGGCSREEIEEFTCSEDGIPAVAHCLSLILLLFCRDMINGPTPGHLFTKPSPGTGASLLADVCTTIACGFAQAAASMPNNDDEMRKTLITFFADGAPVVFFDNINHSVDSGELASAMTQQIYRARRLGGMQTIETEVRSAFVFTGNNVMLTNELLRRLIMIDMDAKIAHPERRTDFKYDDIIAHIKQNRGEFVHACLTIIQNWIAQGKPIFTGPMLNSYESWTRTMGGILESANIGGFMGNREMLKEIASDDSDEEIVPLLDIWWETHGDKPAVVKVNSDVPSLMNLVLDSDVQLPVRMRVNTDGDRIPDGKAFGRFLAGNRGRVFSLTSGEEVMLERMPQRYKHGTLWKLNQTGIDESLEQYEPEEEAEA